MKFPNRHSRRNRDCAAAQATLSALVRPSMAAAQSEARREDTRDAMLREFSRATAPTKEPRWDNAPATAPVIAADGVVLASIENVADPEAAADKVRAIIAKHRSTVL